MNPTMRLLLFIGMCVPLRLGLAYLPSILPEQYLDYLGIVVLTMSLGTLYLGWTNSRLRAPEGGGKTWWAPYRLIHGMLLLTASLYLFRGDRRASVPLLMDVLFAIVLFFIIRVGL
jgi:hypothetical protein